MAKNSHSRGFYIKGEDALTGNFMFIGPFDSFTAAKEGLASLKPSFPINNPHVDEYTPPSWQRVIPLPR